MTTQAEEELVLTEDQEAALTRAHRWLMDEQDPCFVLEGYSGTGKTTLVQTLLQRLPSYIQAIQLIDEEYQGLEVVLTATTHKACENFSNITGQPVQTMHSYLNLRLITDWETGQKRLEIAPRSEKRYRKLIIIDEASFIDQYEMTLIFQQVEDCKILFIGDPAQLLKPKCHTAPVFKAGFTTAKLTKTMRQMVDGVPQSNPITELATAFRHTVETGNWPEKANVDGEYVIWLPDNEFRIMMEAEFTRPDWSFKDSKVLAWTNERVIAYNKHIRNLLKGDPALQVGDYAENNQHITVDKSSIKTDATVLITKIEEDTEEEGVPGNWVTVNGMVRAFHPRYRQDKARAARQLRADRQYQRALAVDNWIDLRAVYAQTVNKAQGSTYGKVFVDLDDIKKCNFGHLIARMLYVGISRAKHQVILRGDIV